ncbi:MAG TPA: cation diffusion facilitator family transporter [Ktedonobacteraceae bacterium]|nr:cation diffusion facilitator family transporter [Ktedonobacteraceae bacterium]
MVSPKEAQREKRLVALSSVGAAIGLTGIKFVVAVLTGSLGILAEATHSALDLVAALMTLFAVRVADKPADATHNYGHSKIENLSAFLEAGLLLGTALWIIYEAIQRLLYHEQVVEASIWAFIVMALAVIVDYSRSRALLRVARKLGSQALEADALHFKTDIWSSLMVIMGLAIVYIGRTWHLPAWLAQADAIAALGVSLIVIWVSARLAKVTIDALLDRAPQEVDSQISSYIQKIQDVSEVRRVRARRAGNKLFADVVIAAPRTLTFEQIHDLSERVEGATIKAVRRISDTNEVDVLVHVEPTQSASETVIDQIHYLAERQGVHAHDIRVREVNGKLEADFDLEVQEDMDLQEAHQVATRLEQAILETNKLLGRVTTHLEAPSASIEHRQDVTGQHSDIATRIVQIADQIAGPGSAHDVHLYQPYLSRAGTSSKGARDELDLVLHTICEPHIPLSQAHLQAEEIQRALRLAYPDLGSVVIHTEPPEE